MSYIDESFEVYREVSNWYQQGWDRISEGLKEGRQDIDVVVLRFNDFQWYFLNVLCDRFCFD